jgi:hypothetical protein
MLNVTLNGLFNMHLIDRIGDVAVDILAAIRTFAHCWHLAKGCYNNSTTGRAGELNLDRIDQSPPLSRLRH